MPTQSQKNRSKSQRFERFVADKFTHIFPDARRGIQGQGEEFTNISDVMECGDLHIECKTSKNPPSFLSAWKQAERAKGPGKYTVVAQQCEYIRDGREYLKLAFVPMDTLNFLCDGNYMEYGNYNRFLDLAPVKTSTQLRIVSNIDNVTDEHVVACTVGKDKFVLMKFTSFLKAVENKYGLKNP